MFAAVQRVRWRLGTAAFRARFQTKGSGTKRATGVSGKLYYHISACSKSKIAAEQHTSTRHSMYVVPRNLKNENTTRQVEGAE